jgi:hypothetical protein
MAMNPMPCPTVRQPLRRGTGPMLLVTMLALALTGCATPVAGPDLQAATQPGEARWTWRTPRGLPGPSVLPGTTPRRP